MIQKRKLFKRKKLILRLFAILLKY